MKLRRGLALLAILTASANAAEKPGDGSGDYGLTQRAAGKDGGYDYISVDPARDVLFIGRSFGVEVFDLKTARYRTLIANKGVAAVLPIGERMMLSTNGEENTATLFDRVSGKVAAQIPTGSEPDGAYYDRPTGLAFVANGESRDITVIDIAARRAVATIPVGGVPEASVGDGHGKLFVNIEDRNVVAVIDIAGRKVAGEYALPGCNEPTGIAHDPLTGLLISACHNGTAKLIDAATGADRGSFAIGQGADGSLFDPVRRIGFVPCLDGTLTVYSLDRNARATVLQRVETSEGARTAAYDTAGDRVFLPTARVDRDAAGEYLAAKSAFAVLTVGREGAATRHERLSQEHGDR